MYFTNDLAEEIANKAAEIIKDRTTETIQNRLNVIPVPGRDLVTVEFETSNSSHKVVVLFVRPDEQREHEVEIYLSYNPYPLDKNSTRLSTKLDSVKQEFTPNDVTNFAEQLASVYLRSVLEISLTEGKERLLEVLRSLEIDNTEDIDVSYQSTAFVNEDTRFDITELKVSHFEFSTSLIVLGGQPRYWRADYENTEAGLKHFEEAKLTYIADSLKGVAQTLPLEYIGALRFDPEALVSDLIYRKKKADQELMPSKD